ncbi:MAG TPA: hypothetical protein VEZ90_17955 [Blastocatellia bacterium]|nr:hypothetical protein [Blastocatellia bacterium]
MKPNQRHPKMGVDRTNSEGSPKYRQQPGARRRERRDVLLADEPPRALGISIAATFVLLIVAGVLAWPIKYQETAPISVDLQTSAGSEYISGLGYLPAEMAGSVTPGQTVRVTLPADWPPGARSLEGTIESASLDEQKDAMVVKVRFPENLVPPIARTRLRQGERPFRVQGQIFTLKVRLFSKMFGAAKTLLDRK